MASYIGKFLDPGQVEQIIREEKLRRKQVRLNQVRQIAHDNAANVCLAVKKERIRQTRILSRKLEDEWRRTKKENLEIVGQEYSYCLHGVGMAHKSVEVEKTLLAEHTGQSIRDRLSALDRGRVALEELRTERSSLEQQREEDLRHRKHIRLVEDERASLVASLPPPPVPTPSAESKALSPSSRLDKSGSPSPGKARIRCPKDPLSSIDVQVIAATEGDAEDARRAAEAEERRLSDQFRQTEGEKLEQSKRERQRFKDAKSKMERERNRNNALVELEELKRLDRLQRGDDGAGLTAGQRHSTRHQEEVVSDMLQQLGISVLPESNTDGRSPPQTASSSVQNSTTGISSSDYTTTLTSSEEPSTPLVHLLIRPEPSTRSDDTHSSDEEDEVSSGNTRSTTSKSSERSSSTVLVSAVTSTNVGSEETATGSGSRSDGWDMEPPTPSSVGFSLPNSTTSMLDDDPSHVILAGLMHGDRSEDVNTVASPTASMLAKVGEDWSSKSGSWTGGSRSHIDDTISTRKESRRTGRKKRAESPATIQHSSASQGSGDSLHDRVESEPVLHVTVRRPPTVSSSSESSVSASGVIQNVAVVRPRTQQSIPSTEKPPIDRSVLLRQLLLQAVQAKNIQPFMRKIPSETGGEPATYEGRVIRPNPRTVIELSTIEEVDSPDVSRTVVDRRRESGGGGGAGGVKPGQLIDMLDGSDAALAAMIRRFDYIFEQGDKGISDEPNLTFVSTEDPSARSLDSSMMAATANATAESFPDDSATTDPFGNSSSVGTWWQDSFQRMAALNQLTNTGITGLSGSQRSGSAVAMASATLSYQEVMSTGTPSCPFSLLSTELGDSTLDRKSQLSAGSMATPTLSSGGTSRSYSSSGGQSHAHQARFPPTATTTFERRQKLVVTRVETVQTPSISTSGSSGTWSGCLTATPTAISPPSDTDSPGTGTPNTGATVMPRTELPRGENSFGQAVAVSSGIPADDGSYPGGFSVPSGSRRLPDISITDSNLSFLSHERQADISSVLDSSGITRAIAANGSGSDGGDARRRSRSLFFSSGSSGSNTASESLMSFLLHEMSALGALTPLELSLSSSHTTTSS